jgi:hypothetical protein
VLRSLDDETRAEPVFDFGCGQHIDDLAVTDRDRMVGQDDAMRLDRYDPAGQDNGIALLHSEILEDAFEAQMRT